jgi:hypothetical protein
VELISTITDFDGTALSKNIHFIKMKLPQMYCAKITSIKFDFSSCKNEKGI